MELQPPKPVSDVTAYNKCGVYLYRASVITGLDYWTELLDSNFNALKTFSTRRRVVYCITLAYKLAVGPPVQWF